MAGALASLKIVEIGEMASAPYASKLMADMGAELIKVERPGVGDHARTRGPFPGGEPHPEKSGLFLYPNTNNSVSRLTSRGPKASNCSRNWSHRPMS
jgi:crotonobetainyl-CoA:carnitine CoA-transferase CaiB-like acyl-CoA transferase